MPYSQLGFYVESPCRSLSSYPELICYLLAQNIHIFTNLVVGDLGINLCGRDMLVA